MHVFSAHVVQQIYHIAWRAWASWVPNMLLNRVVTCF